MSDELSQGTNETLFNDLIVQIQTDTAKQNAIRLFYLDQTQSAFSPQLYNKREDPQTRLNVKVAACWVMSKPSPGTEQRYHLMGAVDDLWRKACRNVRSVLEPLRYQLDDIALLPDFETLESEELYQLFREVFIAEDVSTKDGMAKPALQCPSTREEAVSQNRTSTALCPSS